MDDIYRKLLIWLPVLLFIYWLSKNKQGSSGESAKVGQAQAPATPTAGISGQYVDDGDGICLTLRGWKPAATRRELVVHAPSSDGTLLKAAHKGYAAEKGHFYIESPIEGDSCTVYIPYGAILGCSTPKMTISVSIVETGDGKSEWKLASQDRLVVEMRDKPFSVIVLFAPLLTILKGVAEVDGPLCREEVRYIKDCVVKALDPSEQELDEVRQFLKAPLKWSVREAIEIQSKRTGPLLDAKDTALVIRDLAAVDGSMNAKESDLLRDILGWLGLSQDDIEAFLSQSTDSSSREIAEALGVLGLSGTPSKDELQSARRRAMKDFHPDRYQSADLPDSVKAVIGKQAAAVNVAFDALMKAYGYDRN